jgi:hypothetical protein
MFLIIKQINKVIEDYSTVDLLMVELLKHKAQFGHKRFGFKR